MKIIRPNTSEKSIHIFELYISKQNTIYENLKMWHALLLSVNSVLIGALALIIGLYKDQEKLFKLDSFKGEYNEILIFMGVFGIIFSIIWLLSHLNMTRWQNQTNVILKNLERKILAFPETDGMWTMIRTEDRGLKKYFDVMRIQTILPVCFIIFWIVVSIWALGSWYN